MEGHSVKDLGYISVYPSPHGRSITRFIKFPIHVSIRAAYHGDSVNLSVQLPVHANVRVVTLSVHRIIYLCSISHPVYCDHNQCPSPSSCSASKACVISA